MDNIVPVATPQYYLLLAAGTAAATNPQMLPVIAKHRATHWLTDCFDDDSLRRGCNEFHGEKKLSEMNIREKQSHGRISPQIMGRLSQRLVADDATKYRSQQAQSHHCLLLLLHLRINLKLTTRGAWPRNSMTYSKDCVSTLAF